MKLIIKKLVILTTVIVFNTSHFLPIAHAGIIDTSEVLNTQTRSVAIDKARRFLIQDEVSRALLDLGVNPQWVMERVATLTDSELVELSENIDHAPAGAGVVEVVGIVFIILIILELVGVTDIFKKL